MSYLVTKAPEDMNLQQKNKLKGMAMEYAVSQIMEDLEGSEESLDKVIEQARDYLDDVYSVKKMFRIITQGKRVTFRRQVQDEGESYKLAFDSSEFKDQNYLLETSESSDKIFLGYRKCSYCDYMYPVKFCKKCGGACHEDRWNVLKKISEVNEKKNLEERYEGNEHRNIVGGSKNHQFDQKISQIKKAEWNEQNKFGYNEFCNCKFPNRTTHVVSKDQESRKCRKCNRGNFRKIYTSFSKNSWKSAIENASFKEVKEYLLENGYISESSFADKIGAKRVDTWRYDGEKIEIFESKNKEDTSLTYANVAQAFYYIKALRKAGLSPTEKARIIFNGKITDSVQNSISHFENLYGYSIKPVRLKHWCKDKEKYIETIKIGKDIDGQRISESGEYECAISYSSDFVENPEIVINADSLEVQEA